ncbi:DUF1826 domain-containing protein [Pseudomonas sp. TE3610]
MPRQLNSPELSVLTQVLEDDVNLAIWERQLPLHIAGFADSVIANGMPISESHVLTVNDDHPPLLDDLAAGLRDIEGHAGFVADVAWLTHAFTCLTGARRVGLRVRTLDKAMCPRYHVDWVSLRLITTYAGVGSQWLEEGAMAREQLGDPAAEPIIAPRQLHTGSVALFKGERWEGNEGRGIIHRSPAVPAGTARLFMTLDWLA